MITFALIDFIRNSNVVGDVRAGQIVVPHLLHCLWGSAKALANQMVGMTFKMKVNERRNIPARPIPSVVFKVKSFTVQHAFVLALD